MRATLICQAGTTVSECTWEETEGDLLPAAPVARDMVETVADFRARVRRPFKVSMLLDLTDRTVEWVWGDRAAEADKFEQALSEYARRVLSRDANEGRFVARRFVLGPLRIFAAKEVGPPPWSWPHVGIWPHWDRVSMLVGWRMTAYRLTLGWRESGT